MKLILRLFPSLFFVALLPLGLLSCSTLRPPVSNASETSWRPKAVFLTEKRIEDLKLLIRKRSEITYRAWTDLNVRCDVGLNREPRPVGHWSVPGFYDDPKAQQKAKRPLEIDSTLAYEEALCFKMTGEIGYANEAMKILRAWSTTLKTTDIENQDSALTMSYHFPR